MDGKRFLAVNVPLFFCFERRRLSTLDINLFQSCSNKVDKFLQLRLIISFIVNLPEDLHGRGC